MGSILGKLALLTLIERALAHVQADYDYYAAGGLHALADQELK